MKIKILLVDDHPIVIAGFAKLLSDKKEYEVVGQFNNAREALLYARCNPVDVAVVDINMDGMDGFIATQRFKSQQSSIRVVVLSVNEVEPFISKSFESGADAFLSKRCAPDELSDAIAAVCNGEQFLSKHVYRQMALDKLNKKEDILQTLTKREFEVFLCLARGDTMNNIADNLHISPKTGYVFRGNIMRKLNITTLAELIHLATRHRLI